MKTCGNQSGRMWIIRNTHIRMALLKKSINTKWNRNKQFLHLSTRKYWSIMINSGVYHITFCLSHFVICIKNVCCWTSKVKLIRLLDNCFNHNQHFFSFHKTHKTGAINDEKARNWFIFEEVSQARLPVILSLLLYSFTCKNMNCYFFEIIELLVLIGIIKDAEARILILQFFYTDADVTEGSVARQCAKNNGYSYPFRFAQWI